MIRACHHCTAVIAPDKSAYRFDGKRFCSAPCVKQHIKQRTHEPKDIRT